MLNIIMSQLQQLNQEHMLPNHTSEELLMTDPLFYHFVKAVLDLRQHTSRVFT